MSQALAVRAPAPRGLLWRAPAWTLTAGLGVLCLVAAPPSADLAAASYRSYLFGRAGFSVWDNSWYGGHHLPAYSLLAPALGWLMGPRLVALASMTIAAALFAALVEGRFAQPATRIAAAWFALGAAIALLSWRVPFDLGLALGLGALLLARDGRRALALALAALCAFASPVAGAFLALCALAWALTPAAAASAAGVLPRACAALFPAGLAVVALAPIALLAIAFPEGGSQPFVGSAFYPALAAVLAIAALIGPERPGAGDERAAGALRMLRTGALLYALALVGAYVLHTPVGGNADRLGALAAGPIAACALGGRARAGGRRARWRVRALVVLAPLLLYWQANAPVADFLSAAADPSTRAGYYAPLLGELQRLDVGYGGRPARVEVVPTRDHWEARYVAARVPLARGWERQLDNQRNAIFYEPSVPLTPARYRAWLWAQSVSYVALPDAPLDYSARAEQRLLRGSPPGYLHELWSSPHWRLFAVAGARPLATAPALLTRIGDGSFTLLAPRAGTFLVRVRFTPYWQLASGHGCVSRAGGDWTRVRASRAGSYQVVLGFSPARVLAHGPRCR